MSNPLSLKSNCKTHFHFLLMQGVGQCQIPEAYPPGLQQCVDRIRLRLQPTIGRRRSSSSSRDHSRKTSRFRNKYARKGPMLKKFRPPRHIKIRPSVVPSLHYQKYKEERKTSTKSPKNQRMKSSWWRKPSNILKRSRLRNFSGLKKKYNE